MIGWQSSRVFERVKVVMTCKISHDEQKSQNEKPRRWQTDDEKKTEKKQREPFFHKQNEPHPADVMKTSFPVHV
jgi:hypothetical protein